MATSESKNSLSLVDIISTAIQIPGVKTDRSSFLREQFKGENRELIENIVAVGPVQAGCTRKQLQQMSRKLIQTSTRTSTAASFVAGLPGGLAIAAILWDSFAPCSGTFISLWRTRSLEWGTGRQR